MDIIDIILTINNEIQVSREHNFSLQDALQINLLAAMANVYLQQIDAMMYLIARMEVMNKDVGVNCTFIPWIAFTTKRFATSSPYKRPTTVNGLPNVRGACVSHWQVFCSTI